MREPAFPGATVLGDSGENLPVVLREICADPKRQEILASWIAELTPMDVTGFEFPVDPSGRVHLTLCEANGRKVSAYSASDGTLRFLAMLTVLLGENPPGLYFFEEIDTGIHPARQWLLLELIEKQAAKRGIQVVTTTHSPDLLTFVNDSTFEHLSVVCRLEDSQDAIIRPVAELPNAKKLRKSQGLGKLLTSAWMEDRARLHSKTTTTRREAENECPHHSRRLPQRSVHSQASVLTAFQNLWQATSVYTFGFVRTLARRCRRSPETSERLAGNR